MTSSNQPKPTSQFVLLVFGKPTSADLPQASWFSAEDRPTVIAAANALKFSVLDIQTDGDRSLLVGVHEGVLKGNGRMIVGSVSVEVYTRIEEANRRRASSSEAVDLEGNAGSEKESSEQTTNGHGSAAATRTADMQSVAPPDPWNELRIGSHVVAKHWEADGEPYGWWIGTITGFEKDEFVVVWLDYPSKMPPFRIERKNVAILHPSFDLKTERQRKRR
jgi:hypothetical protein